MVLIHKIRYQNRLWSVCQLGLLPFREPENHHMATLLTFLLFSSLGRYFFHLAKPKSQLILQHQLLYANLAKQLASGLCALQIKAKTPTETERASPASLVSDDRTSSLGSFVIGRLVRRGSSVGVTRRDREDPFQEARENRRSSSVTNASHHPILR